MQLSSKTLWVWFITLQMGTWLNGTSGLIAAFSGQSSKLLSTISTAYPPPRGMENNTVSFVLMISGITVLIGLTLTIVGLIRGHIKKASN